MSTDLIATLTSALTATLPNVVATATEAAVSAGAAITSGAATAAKSGVAAIAGIATTTGAVTTTGSVTTIGVGIATGAGLTSGAATAVATTTGVATVSGVAGIASAGVTGVATATIATAAAAASVADLPVEPVVSSARLLTIFFASLLTNNIALTYFLGMCAFLSLSKKMKVAVGMGIAVVLVMVLTAAVNWVIHFTVLVPLGLDFFQFLVFILVIAAIVQVLELIIDRHFPALYHAFGLFLPLIAVNCAILGASLFMILREYGFLETVVFALGSGLGWMLAICSLTGLRRHLVFSAPPANLGQVGSAIILAGIMAMGFAGFSGMVRL